ncbi:MAG: CYTH domain-containing protein [Bacteroides sp.]|nr:CYTH domain-containing protein [Bacteroides sp.]
MGKEIERKFLVKTDEFKRMATDNILISQGYLCRLPERTVRVRIRDKKGFLTIKGLTKGFSREEYEYEIPLEDARNLLELCEGRIVAKTRWIVPFEGHTWEIDEFSGDNKGLTVAEIELCSEDEVFTPPCFIGEEVTGNPVYYNSNL